MRGTALETPGSTGPHTVSLSLQDLLGQDKLLGLDWELVAREKRLYPMHSCALAGTHVLIVGHSMN